MLRSVLISLVLVFGLLAGADPSHVPAAAPKPAPVIYDTDIGSDMDDTWALGLLLASPELDLKLVTTESGNTEGKAKLAARFLERTGRADVPVGIGLRTGDKVGNQGDWAKDYDLSKYPGLIHTDGVQALIDVIMKASEPITILAVGPVTNLAEALRREPRITEKSRLVLMGGCIERTWIFAPPGPKPESNTRHDVHAAQVAYTADWDVTLAPLDTTGGIMLTGNRYARVHDARNPVARSIMEGYYVWGPKVNFGHMDDRSSGLFDVATLSLLIDKNKYLKLRDMKIQVRDDGMTVEDLNGKPMRVAMEWNDLDAFFDMLSKRLATYQPPVPGSRGAAR